MFLYVMRHGPAEDRASTGRDFDRALTPDGREVVARSARALREARLPLAGQPWLLLTSPLRRAIETSEVISSIVAPHGPIEVKEELGAEAALPLALVDELVAKGADVLLVGHQPNIEELVCELLRPARFQLPGAFPTATLVTLERLPVRWRMLGAFDPHASRA